MSLDLMFSAFSNFIIMQFFAIFSIVFGVIVIANPDIIAYLIWFFFVFLGANMLIASTLFRRRWSGDDKSWKVGWYEIIKNRK